MQTFNLTGISFMPIGFNHVCMMRVRLLADFICLSAYLTTAVRHFECLLFFFHTQFKNIIRLRFYILLSVFTSHFSVNCVLLTLTTNPIHFVHLSQRLAFIYYFILHEHHNTNSKKMETYYRYPCLRARGRAPCTS